MNGSSLDVLLVALVVLIVIFLVCRELVCWYLKINRGIALLTEIRDLLATRGALNPPTVAALPSANQTNVSVPAVPVEVEKASGSEVAARNLAASGYKVEQISRELQRTHGLSSVAANELARRAKDEPPR
jgi:hypothetical protein